MKRTKDSSPHYLSLRLLQWPSTPISTYFTLLPESFFKDANLNISFLCLKLPQCLQDKITATIYCALTRGARHYAKQFTHVRKPQIHSPHRKFSTVGFLLLSIACTSTNHSYLQLSESNMLSPISRTFCWKHFLLTHFLLIHIYSSSKIQPRSLPLSCTSSSESQEHPIVCLASF